MLIINDKQNSLHKRQTEKSSKKTINFFLLMKLEERCSPASQEEEHQRQQALKLGSKSFFIFTENSSVASLIHLQPPHFVNSSSPASCFYFILSYFSEHTFTQSTINHYTPTSCKSEVTATERRRNQSHSHFFDACKICCQVDLCCSHFYFL